MSVMNRLITVKPTPEEKLGNTVGSLSEVQTNARSFRK